MKKLVFLLLIFPMLCAAQNQSKLSLRFALSTSDTCQVVLPKYFIGEYEPRWKSAIVDNESHISITVEKAQMAILNYNHQNLWLFLEPGKEIGLNIGLDSLYKSATFIGKASPENIFLRDFYAEFHKDLDANAVRLSILNNGVDVFENNLYAAHKKQLDFYNNHPDKALFSETFRDFIENTIRYNYYASLLAYPIVNANQSEKILKVSALPDVMMDGVDQKLCRDEALPTEAYRNFLTYYITYLTSKANGYNKFKDYNTSMESKIQTAMQQLTNRSQIWFVASFLNSDCNKISPYTAKHIYSILKEKEGETGVYSQLLKIKCEARIKTKEIAEKNYDDKSVSSVMTTKTSSDYPQLKDMDGKYFTLDDFKGKVVYIDFWASWCGPCRNEMPNSKKLHEMFSARQLKGLVFLYISIDGSEDAWKNAVKDLGIEGTLGISPGNWNSEIVKYFQIYSIPHYMLMDKKGKIVDTNAKRPGSGEEIYNDIIKLLND